MIRVLVVEDSLTVRRYLVEVVSRAPDLTVVGEAGDGQTAIELCERLRPDVISMDMMLPGMNGLSATEHIMANRPTPILIVSASTNRGELFRTYSALAAGAVDVLEKPDATTSEAQWERRLQSALRIVSRVPVVTRSLRRGSSPAPARRSPLRDAPGAERSLVVIGASTGGPGAVLQVLQALPRPFPLPVLVVIHIAEPFARALAEWLADQSGLIVRYAADGEVLPTPGPPGLVLLAPPERHLRVGPRRLTLTQEPPRHACRPAVDVLFESAAEAFGARAVGCLLTGMGRDGASGLLALRTRGALTVAQDEATSVVFGMPGEAVRLGAAEHVLPLPEIGPLLASLTQGPDPR